MTGVILVPPHLDQRTRCQTVGPAGVPGVGTGKTTRTWYTSPAPTPGTPLLHHTVTLCRTAVRVRHPMPHCCQATLPALGQPGLPALGQPGLPALGQPGLPGLPAQRQPGLPAQRQPGLPAQRQPGLPCPTTRFTVGHPLHCWSFLPAPGPPLPLIA